MAEDKSRKGAYINNPEFPYKNLNIKKIERIRKSVSLGSQFFNHKNPINDESGGREPVPRQGNSQNCPNNLSKKFSKSKNFIERNIEKISSLSKKNDMFLRTKKTCNRSHVVGYDVYKDSKGGKAPPPRIASRTAGHDRSETHLRKNTQISNGMIKKNEWVDVKNNITQGEVAKKKKQQTNAHVAPYHADKDVHVTNEGEKKVEERLKESSNVVSPYEEHEMENKESDHVRDRKIKREGTLESQRSADNEIGQQKYDAAGEGVLIDCTNLQRKLKSTDEGEHMYTQSNFPGGYHYGGGGLQKGGRGGDEMCESGAEEDGNEEHDASDGDNEVEEAKGSERDHTSQEETNKAAPPICNSNDAGAGKKEFPEKSISLNDNSSLDTVTNYSVQSKKDYQSWGGKMKQKIGTTKKMRSVDYTSQMVHNETGKALSSQYAHLDSLGKKTNEERLTGNKNVNEFFGNVRSSFGAFDELLSRRLANLKGRSLPPSGRYVLNGAKEEGAHNGSATIRRPNEGLPSRDNYSLNEYRVTGGKSMQGDFSAKYREGQSDEMEKPTEESNEMARTSIKNKSLSDPPSVQNVHNVQVRTCGNGLENAVEEGDSPTEERNPLNEDTLKKELANSYDYEFSSSRKANHSLSGSNFSPLHKNYSTEGENLGNEDGGEAHSDDEDYKSVTEKKSTDDEMEEMGEENEEENEEANEEANEKANEEANEKANEEANEELNEEEEDEEEEAGELPNDLPGDVEDTADDKHSGGSSPEEQFYGEEGHPKEPTRGYFDKSINEDSVEKEHLYGVLESEKIPSRVFLAVNGKEAQKGVQKIAHDDSGQFNKLGGEPFAGRRGEVRAEEGTEHRADNPDTPDEDKHKFLCSSNDTYHVDVLKLYNNKLSHEGGNKKNNKLINKNMILKEIFGSNYESSLKKELNESSNVVGGEEEEEAAEEEVDDEAEEEVEDGAEEDAEEEAQHYPHEDTTQEPSNKNAAPISDGKYDHYVSNKSIGGDAHEPYESQFDKSKSVEKDSFGSELANDEDSLLKRYEENSSPLILSKPLFNDKTSESSYNTSVLMGRAKKESLTFRDTTAGGNSHKERNRNGEVLLKKKGLPDLEDTPNYTEEKRTHNADECSSEYKEGGYTSEAESEQVAVGKAQDPSMHSHVVTNGWEEYYHVGGDRYGESSDAKRAEEPESENEMVNTDGVDVKASSEEVNSRAPNEEEGERTDGLFAKKRKGSEQPYGHYIDEYEQDYAVVNREAGERKRKEVDEGMGKHEAGRDSQGGQYRSYKDYAKGEELRGERMGEHMEERREEHTAGATEGNPLQPHKTAWTRKAQRTSDGVATTENGLTHGHGESHGEKKNNAIWKYRDKKFLIYRDKLFEEKEKEARQRKSHLNDQLLDAHYEKQLDVNKEREYLFDSMSDNYNYGYLRKGRSGKRSSQMMNLYESIKSKMEASGNKESGSSNLKSVISDDYYLDYIKNRRKHSHKYEGEKGGVGNYNKAQQSSNENELTLNKRKRKNIFESDSLINDSKDDANFNLQRNNSEFLEDVKKKIKKIDHIECSHLSYGNSECSKAAALYSSINETTNSSHTIVSKRSKYILKHSNASSLYDDVPLFFNFVNCSSIVLGSEIIYVTDETYGKCENILKDKPFNTANVERGYYEDCSNDLYNVRNTNLSIGIGHHRERLDERGGQGKVAHLQGEQVNRSGEERTGGGGSGYLQCSEESAKWGECPGWLTKRRIKKYFDFCIVKLCKPTLIKGIDIDTNNFLGNYAPYVSIEGAYIEDDMLMSAKSFSKYVDRVKYKKKKKNDLMFEKDFFSHHPPRGRSGERGAHNEKGECGKAGDVSSRDNDCSADVERKDLFLASRNSSGENRYWSNDRRRLGEHVLNNREEVELVIDGKTYFKRNKYFYEPILIDPLDKSDQEYENYLEILRYNDKYKKLRTNPKSTSFVANGNEYRYIDNKLYTLVDVTREIASRYPGIHKGCLLRSSPSPLGEGRGYPGGDRYGERREDGKHGKHGEHVENGNNGCALLANSYNSNALFLDNDYSVEKKIYNDLHKQYQWVSILEDERMNPGFKNYNHNCFNINTCNKIFTHLIVCLLPDGGINKLRVYGEIKISEHVRKKSYKKTINVCDILDGSHVVYTTDEFYGKSENILIDQNSEYVMGWQTRRLINRPLRYVENLTINNMSSIFFNNNYCIIKLSFLTTIKYIEINTIFYEYNFPLCVSIDYCYMKEVHSEEKSKQIQFFSENIENIQWKELLPLSYIKGNHINFFTVNGSSSDAAPLPDVVSSHLRLNIYPDGGINTIKAYGTVVEV
ncbi:hypothetical protein PVMG_04414 [Plasmodium vivax Mauritania I]|uniref:Allantoicase domain-containing protein n=1 Tax=Plasmodium vivax Mauritania I TaxID=1035515 RepID=A0A0J9TKL1_PLAVI|nr:hypothetical protein PVMG_04414 [Plasmodium vivax Mauritania I]